MVSDYAGDDHMPSVPNNPRRRRQLISPAAEQHHYRRLLMRHYWENGGYLGAILQDLQPLFRKAAQDGALDGPAFHRLQPYYELLRTVDFSLLAPLFEDIRDTGAYGEYLERIWRAALAPSGERQEDSAHDEFIRGLLRLITFKQGDGIQADGTLESIELLARSTVRHYLHELYRFVARRHLTFKRQPAGWAAAFVHEHVIAAPYAPQDPEYYEPGVTRELRLTVSALSGFGLAFSYTRDDEGATRMIGTDTRDVANTSGADPSFAPLKPFGYLPALEKAAIRQVQDWFADLRSTLEATHKYRNRANLKSKPEDIEQLSRHLHFGDPLDRNTQEKLRHLALYIALDFPRRDP